MNKTIIKNRSGFTLIELLVAFGIFAIVISIAVGGFIQALRSQRQLAALLTANSNVSLIIEQIAREIRTGTDFCFNRTSCSSPSHLSFINADNVRITYCLVGRSVERLEGNGICGGGNSRKVTADNVNVRYLNFRFFGNRTNDNYPPRITINIGLSPMTLGVSEAVIDLQTTISSRLLDT